MAAESTIPSSSANPDTFIEEVEDEFGSKAIHVASTKIELKASRWAQVYDELSRFHSVRTSQQVHVVVDRDASATDAAVIGLIEHLFVTRTRTWLISCLTTGELMFQGDSKSCRKRMDIRVARSKAEC